MRIKSFWNLKFSKQVRFDLFYHSVLEFLKSEVISLRYELREKLQLPELLFQKFQNWVIEEVNTYMYTEFEDPRSHPRAVVSPRGHIGGN